MAQVHSLLNFVFGVIPDNQQIILDMFQTSLRHFVMISIFWAVQRFARYKTLKTFSTLIN